MIIIKSFLISVLIFQGICSSVSDITKGKISNKLMLFSLLCGTLGNALYFCLGESIFILTFVFNLISFVLVAFLMYTFHIWAGGDVKLFILSAVLIPAEYLSQSIPMTAVTVFIIVFSSAFLYLVFESFVFILKKERTFKRKFVPDTLRSFIPQLVSVYAFQAVLRFALGSFYYTYLPAFLLLNVIIIFSYDKIPFLKHAVSIIICSIITVFEIVFSIIHRQFVIDYSSIILVLVVIVFRTLSERYNYQVIKTVDVKPGMILSATTVMGFFKSRVKGLPKITAEDVSSRITEDEANSIIRWASSKYGEDEIIIVRKMPFALFIFIGFLVYLYIQFKV